MLPEELRDLQLCGYKDLTKAKLNEILQDNFSIGYAVRLAVGKTLDQM